MTPTRKVAANKRNAARSTGPKTAAGKAIARLNATSHGLRAASPVVPGEDPSAWEAFREAMVADLVPVGMMEMELAERVASLSWRLRRVSAFEVGVVSLTSDQVAQEARGEHSSGLYVGLPSGDGRPTLAEVREQVTTAEGAVRDRAERGRLLDELSGLSDAAPFDGTDAVFLLESLTGSLPKTLDLDDDEWDELPSDPLADPSHPRFLLAVGVPVHAHPDPEGWGGWTAGAVRAGAQRMAGSVGWDAKALLSRAATDAAASMKAERKQLIALRKELRAAEQRADVDEAMARRRAMVPTEAAVGTVVKYEGHLQRLLTQTLHQLERRQAFRSDCPPHPPVAVDVTVHAAEDGVTTLLPFKE